MKTFILNSFLFCAFLFLSVLSKAQNAINGELMTNKSKSKSWLVDSDGKRVSKSYPFLRPIYIPTEPENFGAENAFYEFSSSKFQLANGLIRGDGKVIIPDTLNGYFTFINPKLLCLIGDGNAIVYTTDGQIEKAYSENLHFFEEGVLIKEKNGLFAAYSAENVALTEFIYDEFDTGYFLDRNPPILVYMSTPTGEIHAVGTDGTIYKSENLKSRE